MNDALATFNWKSIDTLLLDMDGTLLDLGFDNQFWFELVPQYYAKRHGLTPELAHEEVRARNAAVRGSLNWYCLDYWSETLDIDIAALKQKYRHRIAYLPTAIEFLQHISKQDRRAIIVTNAHPSALAIKLRQTRLDRFVESVVSSHDFDFPKESLEFWPRLRQALGYNNANSCLVDDSGPVLAAAREFGQVHTVAIREPVAGGQQRNIDHEFAVDRIGDLVELLEPDF